MRREEVEKYITELMEKILPGTGIELADVEYVREKDWFLRVFIDKPEGVEIDDCQMVSEKLTEFLDKDDPIKEKYYLEVSSPGIDRPLKKDKDFEDHYGKKVDISFFAAQDGLKMVTGTLTAHDANTVQVRRIIKGREEKQPVTYERKVITAVKPHIEF